MARRKGGSRSRSKSRSRGSRSRSKRGSGRSRGSRGNGGRRYRNVYLGPNSYFQLPNPRNRLRKALINILAQAIDFVDRDTVDKRTGRRIPFTYAEGEGIKASFTGRAQVIRRYAPPKADRVVNEVVKLAKQYAEGKISKRAYEEKVKELVSKAGLDERTIELVVEKVKARD